MAEEHHDHHPHIHHVEEKSGECDVAALIKTEEAAVETKDRGLFGFMGKKEECEEKKPQAEEVDVIVTEFDKVQVSEPEPKVEEHKEDEEKKHGLLEKLHRSGSSSSSSSSGEEEGGEKKKEKKKKGLKEKILGEKKEEDTSVPIEKCEEVPVVQPEEKKGFLEKIKEKLPGQHKKAEEPGVVAPPPPPVVVECYAGEEGDQPKEKKGFLEKIKEKIPGYHPKTSTNEEEKEVSPRDVPGGLPGPQVTGGLP